MVVRLYAEGRGFHPRLSHIIDYKSVNWFYLDLALKRSAETRNSKLTGISVSLFVTGKVDYVFYNSLKMRP